MASKQMIKEDLLDKLNLFVNETMAMGDLKIEPDDDLHDMGLDSMSTVNVIMKIEEEYDISISDNQVKNINTLNDLTNLVVR